ncbi:MAG: hypothetical protein KIH63_001215 [Candidatus Saccharibacteria bacterium]|nr:hypothetical protein [Candidatus Saccharibacteria bacterium]
MASKMQLPTKRLMIDKANGQIIAMIAGATVVVMFSLVASRALLSQRSYQSRVITDKEKAVRQLKSNVDAVSNLVNSYNQFVSQPANVIGGNPAGTGERDGDNARIILDALPSQYDFPALATSLEKLLTSPNYTINSISGTDDEINQQKQVETPEPQPVEIPFEIGVTSTYGAAQSLVQTLQNSIRPFHINKLVFDGSDSQMDVTITAKSYYQPEKALTIRTKDVK